MQDRLLNVNNLTVSYNRNGNEHLSIKDISFSLNKAEILSIIGESGSGKTTLSKAIAGILPTSATISGTLDFINDEIISFSNKKLQWRKIREKKITYIFQDSFEALNPTKKIKEQFIDTICFHKKVNKIQAIEESKKYLSYLKFKEINRVLESYPFALSGGMLQRVCIALALSLNPKILIADEITSNLDVENQDEIIKLLKEIKLKFGLSVVFITHDIRAAALIGDRIIVFKDGIIEEQGDVDRVFKNPNKQYTKELLNNRKKLSSISPNSIKETTNPTILKVCNLSKTFRKGNKKVLHNISFDVKKGDVLGILGESGCGKSTLARCIVGLEKIEEGEVFLNNIKISNLKHKERRKYSNKLQMVFQNSRGCLNPRRKIRQIIYEPNDYLNLYAKEDEERHIDELMSYLNLDITILNKYPPQLSTGQCQRVAIARALFLRPDLLICDEFTSSLDSTTKIKILKSLIELRTLYSLSLIIISHDIYLLRYFCNRIITMYSGKISETRSTLFSENKLHQSRIDYLLKKDDDMETHFQRIIL